MCVGLWDTGTLSFSTEGDTVSLQASEAREVQEKKREKSKYFSSPLSFIVFNTLNSLLNGLSSVRILRYMKVITLIMLMNTYVYVFRYIPHDLHDGLKPLWLDIGRVWPECRLQEIKLPRGAEKVIIRFIVLNRTHRFWFGFEARPS